MEKKQYKTKRKSYTEYIVYLPSRTQTVPPSKRVKYGTGFYVSSTLCYLPPCSATPLHSGSTCSWQEYIALVDVNYSSDMRIYVYWSVGCRVSNNLPVHVVLTLLAAGYSGRGHSNHPVWALHVGLGKPRILEAPEKLQASRKCFGRKMGSSRRRAKSLGPPRG